MRSGTANLHRFVHRALVKMVSTVDMEERAFTMETTADGIVVTRFKDNITLTLDDMRVLGARRSAIANGRRYKALTFIPADIDFDLSVPTTDLSSVSEDHLGAAAIVAATALSERLITMHFGWFPREHPHRVFSDEREALDWLRSQEV